MTVALNRRGSIRWVVLTSRHAYKFPAPYSWRSFLYGLLNNMNEAAQSSKPGACPILWRLPGGWLNVMPRCAEVGEKDFALIDARAWAQDRGLVVEPKRDSFGLLNGAFVAIDYGWPRELRW